MLESIYSTDRVETILSYAQEVWEGLGDDTTLNDPSLDRTEFHGDQEEGEVPPFLVVRNLQEGGLFDLRSLRPGPSLVGRHFKCHVRLFASDVSRVHCMFAWDVATKHMTVDDLNSANGTYVNGRRIESTYTLKRGDVIQVGSCLLTIFCP